MVYIPNTNKKRELKKIQENNKLEERERRKANKELFVEWQKENPGKGLWDYIMKQ